MASDDKERKQRALIAELSQLRGEYITPAQRADMEWLEQTRRESFADDFLSDMPRSLYCKLAGTTSHKVEVMAGKFSLPITGKSIDLYQVIKAFHDFIGKNSRTLSAATDVRDLNAEKIKHEVEAARRKSEMLDFEFAEKKNQFLLRSEVREKLALIPTKLRRLGERIGKMYGSEAQRAVNECIDEIADEIEAGKLRVPPDGKK